MPSSASTSRDVKILLISHAHFDHDAGSAEILRQTHAKYMVMDGDVPVVESGGAKDFAYPSDRYPPATSTASSTMATRSASAASS